MRERVNLPVADGCDRGQHHIEAVKPRPAFNVVKPRGSQKGKHRQSDDNNPQIAQATHVEGVILKQKPFVEAKGFGCSTFPIFWVRYRYPQPAARATAR